MPQRHDDSKLCKYSSSKITVVMDHHQSTLLRLTRVWECVPTTAAARCPAT
jgi:hypothetical protein